MDTSTWMHNQGANCTVGEPAMESGDWMAQPQWQRSVNKIMDNLKRHLPFSGHDRLQELKKIAERVEEEIYTACQSEYTRKICFMMMTMETRLQNRIQSNSAALDNSVKPLAVIDLAANGGDWQEEVYQKIDAMKELFLLESTAQTDNPDVNDGQEEVYQMIEAIKDLYRIESTAPNGEDWQEEVYLKIKVMKVLYLLDLCDAHQKVLSKLQQHDYLPPQVKTEQPERLKPFKDKLEHLMQFLQMPKHDILASYKDKLGTYERHIVQIVNLINGNRWAQTLTQYHQQSQQTHSRFTQRLATADGFQKQNVIDMQKRLCPQKRAVPEPSSTHADNPNGKEWKEEMYQKIKSMKDLYLPELKVIHLKTLSKLQQYDCLPQQPKNEFHVQLKVVKNMLERFMRFLQIPKHGILANHKDKAVSYEMQILRIINANRRSRPRPQNTTMSSVAGPSSSLHNIPNKSSVQQNLLIGDTSMESDDWRDHLQADSRERIINKILDTLKRHLPYSGDEGLQELRKVAERFEEKTYAVATSQSDYIRKISLKMLAMETRSQYPNPMLSNSDGNSVNP